MVRDDCLSGSRARLRLNLVPVAVLTLGEGGALTNFTEEVRHVDLGGHGIRDITRVQGGFLILSGPVGDGPPNARLFFSEVRMVFRTAASSPVPSCNRRARSTGWQGRGHDVAQDDGAEKESWDLLVVYDGVVGGAPKRFKVRKPKAN